MEVGEEGDDDDPVNCILKIHWFEGIFIASDLAPGRRHLMINNSRPKRKKGVKENVIAYRHTVTSITQGQTYQNETIAKLYKLAYANAHIL